MNKILVSTVILLDVNNKFLMEKYKNGNTVDSLWKFPGGKVEDSELVFDAAIRELKEELGIVIRAEDLKPSCFIDYIKDNNQFIIFYFICKKWLGSISSKEEQILDWFSLSEAKKENIITYNQQALSYIVEILKK